VRGADLKILLFVKPRVLLLSTVHTNTDSRIVYKLIPTLAAEYQVYAALVSGGRKEVRHACFISVPHFRSVWARLLVSCPAVLLKCLRIRPAVLHFFVPELIPVAFLFRWLGTRVIYEVQENLYKKFEIKRSNNSRLLRFFFRCFDRMARKYFHLVLTEDAYLREYHTLKFPPAVIHNYVSLKFIRSLDLERRNRRTDILYSGVISAERCFDTVVKALTLVRAETEDFRVHFFGPERILPGSREDALAALPDHIRFYGQTDLPVILRKGNNCMAGIALLKPVGDYPDSYPTKLFEYMALGLPVITSDFQLYRHIIETNRCGFCVSPCSPSAVAGALLWLLRNPSEAALMGRRGEEAVKRRYNWESEEPLLKGLYAELRR